MNKALEMVRTMINGANEYEKKTGDKNPSVYFSKDNLLIIEQALQRLEAIDNANPSEALECLKHIKKYYISEPCSAKTYDCLETIKQALLKAQEPKQYVDELKLVEKKLKALEIIKKLFNPEKYNFLELYENPFITIGEKGEKYRIDSTDDSYIHVGIPKEEYDLLKEVLE